MKILSRSAFALLLFSMATWPAEAQLDLAGTWDLEASGVIPQQPTLEGSALDGRGVVAEACVFEGSGDLVQDGSQITGQATLALISGPADCPSEMMADVMGSLDGSDFGGMLDGGQLFGGLNFVGAVSQDGRSIQGTYVVKPDGPFSDVTDGSWSASRSTPSVLEIPTLGPAGVALLAILLSLAALGALRSGRTVGSSSQDDTGALG